MKSLVNSQDSTASIQRLARTIKLSQGQFSLLFACCNSTVKQQQVLRLLQELSTVKHQEIQIPSSAETLYTTIANILGSTQPEAVIVTGLESVVAINQLLISTNQMRDELRKQFKFPLVLWVNDEIIRKMVWLAPDLKNWAASTIRFDMPRNQLRVEPISA